ncbi:MAG: hypothetical protein ACI4QY_05815 [Oscillospiraceae bacterium]
MDIIEQIIKMDKAAEARVREAVERESSRLNETDEQAQRESRAVIEAERKAAEAFEAESRQKLDEKLRQAEETRNGRCRQLDEAFAAHKTEWKSEIIGRITGG